MEGFGSEPQQQPELRQMEQQRQLLQDPAALLRAERERHAAALEWVKAYEPDCLPPDGLSAPRVW